jgi:hypothetical protein
MFGGQPEWDETSGALVSPDSRPNMTEPGEAFHRLVSNGSIEAHRGAISRLV